MKMNVDVGNEVWIPHDTEAWVRGVVTRNSIGKHKSIEVRTSNGALINANPSQCELDVGTHESIEELANITDLTKLPALHEPILLATIQERFKQGHIYTYTGPILIAINPFKDVGLYNDKTMQQYMKAPLGQPMPPHAYAVADAAFKRMVETNGTNQSILVSGESGAGKTVTTKIVMEYLTAVSGKNTAAASGTDVSSKILQANPLLESFGNAKTLRNNNSSRFGKLIKMHFDDSGRILNGAQITTYLLEKARVTQQSDGERNYHIMYELIAGATPAQRKAWDLPSIKNAHYLNQSRTTTRGDIDDKVQFQATLNAMNILGISPGEQVHVFQVISAILHLGNVHFEGSGGSNKEGTAVAPGSHDALDACARLLSIDPEALEQVLCARQIVVGRGDSEVLWKPHTLAQSEDSRDALAMTLYERLFGWIVWRTNHAIGEGVVMGRHTQGSSTPKQFNARGKAVTERPQAVRENVIGCLDVFGFEVFKTNSFEQLCINYCNEQLQKHFNEFVFEIEQAEYAKEGIDWNYVEFPDNSECISMIESKPIGLMSLLDEQCMFATGNDKSFASKLYDNLPRRFESFTVSPHQKVAGTFSIRHFAGDVEYTTTGFFKKNKNELRQEAVDLLVASEDDLVKILLPMDADKAAGGADMAKYFSDVHEQNGSSGGSSRPQATLTRRASQLQQKTVSSHFKSQLQLAMSTIRASEPHFVRCLKPNDQDKPMFVNPVRLVEQLRYSGVIEVIRVARAGYPSRFSLGEFVGHFSVLSKLSSFEAAKLIKKKSTKELKKVSLEIIEKVGLTFGQDFQVGLTKVFLRADAYTTLQLRKNDEMSSYAVSIQRAFRAYVPRKKAIASRRQALAAEAEKRQKSIDERKRRAEDQRVKEQAIEDERRRKEAVALEKERIEFEAIEAKRLAEEEAERLELERQEAIAAEEERLAVEASRLAEEQELLALQRAEEAARVAKVAELEAVRTAERAALQEANKRDRKAAQAAIKAEQERADEAVAAAKSAEAAAQAALAALQAQEDAQKNHREAVRAARQQRRDAKEAKRTARIERRESRKAEKVEKEKALTDWLKSDEVMKTAAIIGVPIFIASLASSPQMVLTISVLAFVAFLALMPEGEYNHEGEGVGMDVVHPLDSAILLGRQLTKTLSKMTMGEAQKRDTRRMKVRKGRRSGKASKTISKRKTKPMMARGQLSNIHEGETYRKNTLDSEFSYN